MSEPKALVRNAGDPKQVKNATEAEVDREARRIGNLGVVLSTYEGREDSWEFLKTCGLYRSIFDGHGSRMSYNAGRQDVGLERLAMITQHYPTQYLLMQNENMVREQAITEPEPSKDE